MKLFRGFKLIFSRLFAIALAVIAQVLIITYFMFMLTQSYAYFQIIESVIGLLVFIILVNKRMNPEQKIIWACLVIVFPIIGITLYILFRVNRPSKKRINKFTKFDTNILNKDDSYINDIHNISNKYIGQIKYLEKMSGMLPSKNTQSTYYKDGNKFYSALINDLKQAKRFIFMEYFIIKHGKMWDSIEKILIEKAAEGLDVRFIYDDIGSAKYVKGNYDKKLRQVGIKCYKFNKMIPLVSSYLNNRDHRKITIIDGKLAYTGGINLADEYLNINSPYGYWKDNAIRLYGEGVDNFTILFLQNYALVSNQVQNFKDYLFSTNNEKEIINNEIVFPYGTGPGSQYYDNMAADVFLNLIGQATKSIDISTPYLIIDYQMTNALIAAAARGVKVRLLIPSIPDKKLIYAFSKQTAYELALNGVEIYTYTPGFNHAKSFLVDDEVAFTGTTNLDFRSLIHHYECGVWLYNVSCIKDIDINFEKDYLVSKHVSAKQLKMSLISRIIISFLKLFQSLL